jgi:hypothetical protein
LEKHVTSIFTVKEQAKQEASTKQAASRASFLLDLVFKPKDGGIMFLQNVS